MSMIDRYKKRGGFLQLVQLIETTSSPKREQFLKMIADENPAWESAVKQKMLTIERMATWNASYLMEFFPTLPHMAIACGIHPFPEDKRTIFLSSLSFGDRKKVEAILKEHKPNSGEIASSQMKIIGEVRKMVAAGKLKFEKFDADLAIQEDIEEALRSGAFITNINTDAATEADLAGAAPEGNTSSVGGGGEALALRRKVVALTQENTRLMKENKDLKEKLDSIRAAVQKIA